DARRLVVMGPAKPRTDLELRRDLGGDVTEDVEGAGPRKAGLLLALGGLEVGGNALRDQRVQSVARRRGDSLQQRAGEKRVAEQRDRRRIARRAARDQPAAV